MASSPRTGRSSYAVTAMLADSACPLTVRVVGTSLETESEGGAIVELLKGVAGGVLVRLQRRSDPLARVGLQDLGVVDDAAGQERDVGRERRRGDDGEEERGEGEGAEVPPHTRLTTARPSSPAGRIRRTRSRTPSATGSC